MEIGKMATSDRDVMEDLAYFEAEGASEMAEDSGEYLDLAEDELEDQGEYAEDSLDFEDDLESEDDAEESIGAALGQILSAEDEDEFRGKLFSGAKRLIQKAAPVVGKIARGAAPILSMIPHPAAQVAGKVANVLGKLRAEGDSVEDALEAVAE